MKAILNRRKARTKQTATASGEETLLFPIPSRGDAAVTSFDDQSSEATTECAGGVKDGGVPANAGSQMDAYEIVKNCDQLIRKVALIRRIQSREMKKSKWNEQGVAETLCPARMDQDIRDLETVVRRLETLVQNEHKIAVHLQKAPEPCFLLDPEFHEAAAKVLGEPALKTVLNAVEAAESVEKFVKATNEDEEETREIVKKLTENFEQEKNHLAYMMSVVKKAFA